MDIKEWVDKLKDNCTSNNGKYVPWWEDNFDKFEYSYSIFSKEEIQDLENSIDNCDTDELYKPAEGAGLTGFQLLVWHNFYGAVEKILNQAEGHQNINHTDRSGRGITALMLACSRGNFKMAKLLLKNGADDTLADEEGRNVFHYLAKPHIKGLNMSFKSLEKSLGQRKSIASLMKADINKKNAQGLTPLELIITEQDSSYSWVLAETFIEKGAAVNYVDEDGDTLLMIALKRHHITAALKLMEYSEMVNQSNKEGKTPLQWAADCHNEGFCIALKDYGAEDDIALPTLDLGNLSRIAGNAFAGCSGENKDSISMGLFLTKKLIERIDIDDDDEIKYISDIFYNALHTEEGCGIIDLCKDAGIDFIAPVYSGSSVTCLRDECFIKSYSIDVIKKLQEIGVDLNEAVINGKTPVNIIASKNKRNMFSGEKDVYFQQAAGYFSAESMTELDVQGTTAMHQAAKYGHDDMIKVMIEKGADVNVTEDKPANAGDTPLHTACSYGNADVVKVLMENGADDAMQNIDGETPSHLAVQKKKFGGELSNKERAAILKQLKNLDIARNDGRTPLMLLQYLGINEVNELMPLFLEKGVDVNKTDINGNTVLMIAADTHCFKDIIKALVRNGADVNAVNKNGDTALHFALRYRGQETARFLIKKGADTGRADNNGVTPLQLAVENGCDTILMLMDNV